MGFAMGDPFLPVWSELLLVIVAGGAPILWMQWQRPFYIFSIVAVSVKPEALTDDQRRLLSLFKLPRNRLLALFVAVVLIVVLRKIYEIAPIATTAVSALSTSHAFGLLLASASFFACNLFSQVPVSVASVMLSRESSFNATTPYPLEQVRQSFMIVGLQLKQILPPVIPETPPALATVMPLTTAEAAIEPSQVTSGTGSNPLANDLWSENTEPALNSSTSAEKTGVKKAEAVREAEALPTEADLKLESDR